MMIELQNVGFAYNNKHTVFSNLNLYIDRGDIVSIVGNSGCGKTTLLNLIAGVLLPSKGEIKKSDKNIAYLMQDVTYCLIGQRGKTLFLLVNYGEYLLTTYRSRLPKKY